MQQEETMTRDEQEAKDIWLASLGDALTKEDGEQEAYDIWLASLGDALTNEEGENE